MFLSGIRDAIGLGGTLRNGSCNAYENKAWTLSFNTLKARKIARLLYQNATIYLDRKYTIYQKFCRVEEESSTLQSSKIGESWDGNPEIISGIA
jgi:hypothetical protein